MLPAALNLQRTARRMANRIADRWAEFRGYTPVDRNLFYLCVEIVPIGIAAGAFAFNGPFVLKLGGSNALLGAMASLPALMIILFAFPAARLMERVRDRRPWITGTLGLSRMAYLVIGIAPWLLPHELAAYAIVGAVVVQAIPLALFNTAFTVLIADVCPPNRRSALFAMRTTLLSASVAVGAFASGLFLDVAPFPLNYQILNLIGFVLAQYSTWLVDRIVLPVHSPAAAAVEAVRHTAAAARQSIAERIAAWRRFVTEHRPYVNFNIVTLICWLGAWGAAPLYTIYFVRELGLSNSWIGLNSTLAQVAVVVSASLWTKLIARKGDLWVLLRTVLLTGVYPVLIVLLPWPTPILMLGFLNTLNDTGIGITHPSLFFDIIPPAKRNSFVAAHSIMMNVGAMIAPLAAAPLADSIGVAPVLIICGLFRFGGGILFWLMPPRPPAPAAPVAPAT